MRSSELAYTQAIYPILGNLLGYPVHSVIPKQDKDIVYPYVYLGDFYSERDGVLNCHKYAVDFEIRVVYKDIVSKMQMLTDMDEIAKLFDYKEPFPIIGWTISNITGFNQTSGIENTDTDVLHISYTRGRFDMFKITD